MEAQGQRAWKERVRKLQAKYLFKLIRSNLMNFIAKEQYLYIHSMFYLQFIKIPIFAKWKEIWTRGYTTRTWKI